MDEHDDHGAAIGWAIVVLAVALLVLWGVFQAATIPEAPRQWNFETFDDTPGESPYSTAPPPEIERVPRQMEPLPEARPTPKQEAGS